MRRQAVRPLCVAAVTLLWVTLAGCDRSTPPGDAGPTSRVAVAVAPLGLLGLTDVTFDLTVTNALGDTVFSRAVSSAAYGAGDGSLAYVGPCDAGAAANPNTVTLTVTGLYTGTGDLVPGSEWTAPPPLAKPVTCLPDADVPVRFDVTVARAASQGFFDIGVTFDDIFCSAKLDCVNAQGQPLELLHHPATGERDTTIVVAFACTAGPATGGGGQPTWLHMDALAVDCSDGTRMTNNPSGGPGNTGPAPPYLFQRAVYVGEEALPGVSKCYWNHALGVDLAAIPNNVDCTLTGRATASGEPWEIGNVPAGQVRPAIVWNVDVIADGELACGKHALGVADSGVATQYIGGDGAPERFGYSLECQSPISAAPNGALCTGNVPGFSDQVVFADTGDGLVVVIGDATSDPLPLPPGVTASAQCCLDPCCTAP